MQPIQTDRVLYRPCNDGVEKTELLPAMIMAVHTASRVDLCIFWPHTPTQVDNVLMQNVHIGEGPGEWRWRPDGSR